MNTIVKTPQDVPKGMDVLGVVISQQNCVVEKLIGELKVYLEQYNICPVIALEDNPRGVMDYIPKWVMYNRCGVRAGTPPQVLGSLEGHIGYFRSIGVPVYYHIDDALLYMNNDAPMKLLAQCDYSIVASNALAEYVMVNKEIKKPVYILKTHMELNSFDGAAPSTYLVKEGMYNILFSSQGRIGALMLRRIIERMNDKYEKYSNVNLVMVAYGVAQIRSIVNEFRNVSKTYYEFMPLQEYHGLAKACNLVISPGEVGDLDYMIPKELQTFWLDVKSCIKYILAGAAKIPCISAPLREYSSAIKHKETGFMATTIEEWMEYIDWCIENPIEASEIGRAARTDVENNWEARERGRQFAEIFRGSEECLCTLDKEEGDVSTQERNIVGEVVSGRGYATEDAKAEAVRVAPLSD